MTPKQTLINFPEFANNGTKTKPDDAKYAQGFLPADVLPAEWTNYFLNGSTKGITDLNAGITSIEEELINVLTAAGIEPATATKNQVLTAIQYLITAKTGTLSDLTTEAKNNLVAALNESIATAEDVYEKKEHLNQNFYTKEQVNNALTEYKNYFELSEFEDLALPPGVSKTVDYDGFLYFSVIASSSEGAHIFINNIDMGWLISYGTVCIAVTKGDTVLYSSNYNWSVRGRFYKKRNYS